MIVGKNKRLIVLFSMIFSAASCVGVYSASQASSSDSIELPQEAVSKRVLDNGLVILVKESPPIGFIAIDIRINAGSSLEGEYLGSGISHLVEHMVFKGTKTMKPGQIETEIKACGGFLNGSTSYDTTSFHVTAPSDQLPRVLKILKDMLTNASFEKAECEKERDVVLSEVRLNDDEPQSKLIRQLFRTAYISHPYRHPVIGYESKLRQLTQADLIKYYKRMYVPNRMVVSVVGGVTASDTMQLLESEFKDIGAADYSPDTFQPEPRQASKRSVDIRTDINLAYLAMAFHSTNIFDHDIYAMDVLSMIIGRGDRSKLNELLLKKRRLVYSVSAWNYTPRDPGLFVITAVLNKENMALAEDEIMSEISRIKKGEVAEGEIKAAKRNVLSDYIFSRQTIEAQVTDLSESQALTGSYDYSRRYVNGVQAVSKDDLVRAANIYLDEPNLTVVRLLPSVDTGAASRGQAAAAPDTDTIKSFLAPNGLKILLREDNKTPTVSITCAFLGGVLSENAGNNGISSLTATMLTKGTDTRPEGQIVGAIEALGGEIGPFSGMDSFGLNISVLRCDLDAALGILRDVLMNSTFPDDQLEKEKAIALAMIKERDDDIFQRSFDALKESLYGARGYGLPYLGKEVSVQSLNRENLLKYYKAYCVAGNTIISVSGDIDAASLSEKMQSLFKDLNAGEAPSRAKPDTVSGVPGYTALEMDRQQSLVAIAFRTASIKAPDKYAIEVLSSVMSGYSGRLFEELRDKSSLAYTLGCESAMGIDAGYMVFYAATTKERVAQARKALKNEIISLASKGIGDEELSRAKKELVTRRSVAMQTNGYWSLRSAIYEICGVGYDSLYGYNEAIGKVTKEDVKNAAASYLDLGRSAEVVVTSK